MEKRTIFRSTHPFITIDVHNTVHVNVPSFTHVNLYCCCFLVKFSKTYCRLSISVAFAIPLEYMYAYTHQQQSKSIKILDNKPKKRNILKGNQTRMQQEDSLPFFTNKKKSKLLSSLFVLLLAKYTKTDTPIPMTLSPLMKTSPFVPSYVLTTEMYVTFKIDTKVKWFAPKCMQLWEELYFYCIFCL